MLSTPSQGELVLLNSHLGAMTCSRVTNTVLCRSRTMSNQVSLDSCQGRSLSWGAGTEQQGYVALGEIVLLNQELDYLVYRIVTCDIWRVTDKDNLIDRFLIFLWMDTRLQAMAFMRSHKREASEKSWTLLIQCRDLNTPGSIRHLAPTGRIHPTLSNEIENWLSGRWTIKDSRRQHSASMHFIQWLELKMERSSGHTASPRRNWAKVC